MVNMTHIRKLAKFIAEFNLEKAPDSVAEAAVHCVLDTVGAAAGASMNEEMKSIYEKSRSSCGGGPCTVWGMNEKLPLMSAAMYNAMMGHYLELDDVHAASKTHIGTVAVPAAWALCEQLGKSGRELLEAVICAYETEARIGMGIGVKSHRELGWHATGTMGVFGAAAAGAKLMGLSENETVHALGLAGTQSAGLWAFLAEGANTKILHAGNAARCGITAAVMAGAGVRGAEHILEAEDGGLFRAMSEEYDFGPVSEGLGKVYEILNVEKKPYPCCRSTHSAIDAALEMRERGEVRPDNIDSVEIATYFVGYKQCGSAEKSKHPQTSTEAKFSTAYCAACAMLYGAVEEKYFYPPYLGSAEIMQLCQKVRVYPDEKFTAEYPEHWGAELTVTDRNRARRTACVSDPLGSRARPISVEALIRKVSPAFSQRYGAAAEDIINGILKLKSVKVLPKL